MTEFGPFHCEQNYLIGYLRGTMFFGWFLSMVILVFVVGNSSRKKILSFSTLICSLGCLLLLICQSLLLACIGLFAIGFGNFVCVRLSVPIISEITEKHLANKFISSLMVASTIGGILIAFAYYGVKEWRTVILWFHFLPSILIFVFTLLILRDTPQSLLKTKTAE